MILSVSRRTDIPAFYLDWFFKRISEGYALVRNPMNYRQVSRVVLNPEPIDCIVFWTKDPSQIIDKLDLLKDYHYYFQITITPYDRTIEKNLPSKNEVINSFKKLSEAIGSEKVIWRYDPIIINNELTIDYHVKHFESLASQLHDYTNKCIISFLDIYRKTERNMKGIGFDIIGEDVMKAIGARLVLIGEKYDIKLETCCELVDLSAVGIKHAKCIDDELISKIIGQEIEIPKDKNQREVCGCVSSIDIGAYNTCSHKCIYCYANFSD
ncbi:MAG: DUF1848 domain-containing protein, partial [Syntrophomonadaceae bacterium]|nr:DUF1848 domain-containing protein [Syntrophomonadaceae bacterium]